MKNLSRLSRQSMRWTPIVAAVLAILIPSQRACAAPRTARKNVQDGIQKHAAGDYESAAAAFAKAAEELPEDPRVAYNQACALAAQGSAEEATDLFQRAATSRDAALVAASQYNLGCLATEQAKSLFGDKPEEAAPEVRQQGISHLQRAVMHYRDCLRVDGDHEQARKNLEVLRLWIKHMRDEWKRRDRERRREEMGLPAFLEWIQTEQRALEAESNMLARAKPSPRQRQAVSQAARNQRLLAGEIDPLQTKLEETLNASRESSTSRHAANTTGKTELQSLAKIVQRAKGAMFSAADDLAVNSISPAVESQAEAIEALHDVYRAVAPYERLLQKATEMEKTLIDTTARVLEDNPDEEAAAARETASRDQRFVSGWSEALIARAEARLAQWKPTAAEGAPNEAFQKQQAARKESYEKAIELGPKVVELAEDAAAELTAGNWQNARPQQEEALRLLKEIAPKSPPQDQQQQDDQEQNEKNQQQADSQSNRQQDEERQRDGRNEKQQQQQTTQESRKQQQQRKLSRQEAEALLRKVRQRERDYREQKKQLQRILQGAVPVERDW